MKTVYVELVGTSPMLHNRLWSDGSGWMPTTDMEQARSRLWDGGASLPGDRPVIAIGRAAWSRYGWCGARWPRGIVHADACRALTVERVAFDGGRWKPHAFERYGLAPVALPRFDNWTASFTLAYDPEYHEPNRLHELLEHAGRHLGLPQFAPFAGPGPWGRFDVAKWEPIQITSRNHQENCDAVLTK